MNKQSLTLFGGALLATTALSTTSQAAIVVNGIAAHDGTVAGTSVAATAKPLATEVFHVTATSANTVKVGTTGTNVMIDFSSSLTSGFNVQLNVTGASFTGTPTVSAVSQSTSGTVSANAISVTGCQVQLVPDKLLITGCTAGGTSTISRADALVVSGVSFISAGALATAGNSIKLDGIVTNAAGSITFESITSVNFVTSKSAVEASVVPTANLTLDNLSTPAFIKFVTPAAASATIGSVHFSTTAAVATNLSNVYVASASLVSTAELKVTHGALSDPALVNIQVAGTLATPVPKTSAQFVSGTVSFQLPGASLAGVDIIVTFDGTSAISAAAGTATAVVTPTARGDFDLNRAVTAFSGNLATISRGGMSVELNSLYPTAGQGSTLYRSYLRIANISPLDGVATITVKNDSTGAAIGSFTTTVTAGATKQVGAADIEAAISTAAATGAMYKVTVSGSFNGYVQHLIWNSVTGLFTDQSGFRNGALTVDP